MIKLIKKLFNLPYSKVEVPMPTEPVVGDLVLHIVKDLKENPENWGWHFTQSIKATGVRGGLADIFLLRGHLSYPNIVYKVRLDGIEVNSPGGDFTYEAIELTHEEADVLEDALDGWIEWKREKEQKIQKSKSDKVRAEALSLYNSHKGAD